MLRRKTMDWSNTAETVNKALYSRRLYKYRTTIYNFPRPPEKGVLIQQIFLKKNTEEALKI